MSIKLVIFDIAGTTVEDPDGVGGCLKAALTEAGIGYDNAHVNSIMGIPKPMAIRELLEAVGESPTEERITAIHNDFQTRMMNYYRNEPGVRPVEGAEDVFRLLREAGLKVALDTGFDRSIVDVLLARLGWDSDLLDATATSDEVERGRPYPDLVFHLMKLLSIASPAEVVKVGDTPSDLHEGTSARCGMVIGITSGTHSRELLEPHPHTVLVNSVRDVPVLLGLKIGD